ncbi:MAG: PKD domain-containing protein, partial [Thermoplasmata archaeon]
MKSGEAKLLIVAILAIAALILSSMSLLFQEEDEWETNKPPTAQINMDPATVKEFDTIHFDGSGSEDSDGIIIEYTWDFGDGNKDSGMYSSHSYSSAGIYAVSLTVIDNFGGADAKTQTVNVTEGSNTPPTAQISEMTTSVIEMELLYFNASGSSDSDGTITEYSWDFADGTKDNGMYSIHYYSSAGTYTVELTVVDDKGAMDTDMIEITVAAQDIEAQNELPVAAIIVNATTVEAGSYLGFNGSASTDTDGAIVEYTWDFGDGVRNSGMYSSNIYHTGGTYRVILTVMDDKGGINRTNIIITVTEEPELTAPTGVLQFTESTQISGSFLGGWVSLSPLVDLSDTSITITDDSLQQSTIQDPIDDGATLQIPGGMNCTYYDNNLNGKMDGGDTIRIYYGDDGDQIKFVHKPTGGMIGQYVITVTLTTPMGTLEFTESATTPGFYIGCFVALSASVPISDVSLTITDDSLGASLSQDPLNPGSTLQIPGGLNCTYYDNNQDSKIDAGDTIRCYNVSSGDIVTFVYKPTGGMIDQYIFTITQTTPTGALDFTESTTTTGLYTGSFVSLSKSVPVSDVSLTITDDSAGTSESQDPLNPGTTLQIPGGLNCTYYDNNANLKIDGGDTIRCYNAASGDIIKFVYIPTGGVIAQYTFL